MVRKGLRVRPNVKQEVFELSEGRGEGHDAGAAAGVSGAGTAGTSPSAAPSVAVHDHGTQRAYHVKTAELVIAELKTDGDKGLTATEARRRLGEYGYNELSGKSGPSVFKIFFWNFVNAMNIILMLAFGISLGVGDYAEATVVGIVIVTNTLIGFFQEFRSEKTMEALRKLSSPTARIMRDGELAIDLAPEIVPGDIIYLEEGDQVAADIRLLASVNLEIDEILLTGESMPVKKSPATLTDPEVSLGDRKNLAFKNTIVTKGRGHGVVVFTGMSTEIGLIAASVTAQG
eukprot:Opistho-1_new@22980